VLLSLLFLKSALAFARGSSVGAARRVLRTSLVYLPALLLLLLVDGAAERVSGALSAAGAAHSRQHEATAEKVPDTFSAAD
jgi:hypothetical protein